MSSIIDIFTTVFRADTGDLDQGLQDSERNSQDLADSLIDVDAGAAAAGESFKNFAGAATAAIAGLLSVGALISNAVQSAADIEALAQTSESLNIAIEDLDAFGRAAALAGGEAEGARDTLTDVAEKIGEAFTDAESGAAKAFKDLGVNIKDSAGKAKDGLTAFLDLASAVEGMDKSQAVFKLKELGIGDNRAIEMALKGRKELERMIQAEKEQGVITKENAEIAKRFNDAMNSLTGSFDRVAMGLNAAVLPALTVALEWIKKGTDWVGEHRDLLVGFFGAIAAVVTAVYLPAMIRAAIATLAATWPMIAIIAAVTALAAAFALAYDDVMNFLDGNDSLIGEIFEKYPKVKDVVYSIIDAFKFMGDVVAGIWQMLIVGFQQVIDFVGKGVKQIKDGVSTVANFFGIGEEKPEDGTTQPRPAPSREKPPGRDEDVPYVSDGEPAAPKAAQRPQGRDEDVPYVSDGEPRKRQQSRDEDVPEAPPQERSQAPYATAQQSAAQGQKQLATAAASPLNATTSNSISNSVANNRKEVNVSIGEVKVETQAKDAEGMAQGAAGALTSSLKGIESEFATGRDR